MPILNFCDDVHVASFKKFHKELTENPVIYGLFCLKDRPLYSRMGRHLVLTNSRTTTSDAVLPIFPKIPFTAR